MKVIKTTTIDEIKKRIETEPDFIYSSRYNNSLEKLLKKYPNGCKDKLIAQVLLLDSPAEVEEIWQGIVEKLRKKMI